MSFREKSAWISFVLVLLLFVVWVVSVSRHNLFGIHGGTSPLTRVLVTLAAFLVAELVLHVAIAVQSPSDARTPKDERERLIDLKAARAGFYTLAVGVWIALGSMHIRYNTAFVVQHVMAALFVGELVKLGTQIVLYRRDA